MADATSLGPYEIIEQVRRGRSADSYLARHGRMRSKQVLLRVLHDEAAADEAFVRAFVAEARTAAKLQHDCIASVIDLETESRPIYTVLEYIEGPDLGGLLQAFGPVPPEIAAGLLVEVCRGLEYAHAASVLHRRLRPRLIKVTPDGRVKILGFGVREQQSVIQATVMVSDVAHEELYRSPEQVREEPEGPASDLYSLGVIFFELLTGRMPFTSLARYGAEGVASRVPPRISDLKPLVPAALARTIERMLAERASDRPESAAAVRREAQAVLDGGGHTGGADLLRRFLDDPEAYAAAARRLERTLVLPPPPRPPGREDSPPRPRRLAWGIGIGLAAIAVIVAAVLNAPGCRRQATTVADEREDAVVAPATGSVLVASIPPGARATLLEPSLTLVTDTTFANVPEGLRRWHVEKDGYVPRDTSLAVVGGQTARLVIALQAAAPTDVPCSLYVQVSPRADRVLVDNLAASGGPTLFWSVVPIGRHRLAVHAEGFLPWSDRVEITASSAPRQLAVVGLRPDPNSLRPETTSTEPEAPPGADVTPSTSTVSMEVRVSPASDVLVDNVPVAKGVTRTVLALTAGTHEIRVENPDFVPARREVDVRLGKRLKPFRVDLTAGKGGVFVDGPRSGLRIFVDDQFTGRTTPERVTARAGARVISVREANGTIVASRRVIVDPARSDNLRVAFTP